MSYALARGRQRRADEAKEEAMRGISRCWQNQGFHVYGAGPCFDKITQAQSYRGYLDRLGVTWLPQT